ncbi:MAG: hypothetical protein NVS4B10_10280 [Myxococcales bacterium]
MGARAVGVLALLLTTGVSAPAAAARTRPAKAPAPSTVGLGRSCKASTDCRSQSQRCLHESDANGKPTALGFCVLPCATFESGTSKVVPGQPAPPAYPLKKQLKKKPKPRCPPKFECRSKGAGVPIDMCVKE